MRCLYLICSVYQVVEFPGRSLKYYSPIVTHGKIFGLILTRGKSIKPKILPCVTMGEWYFNTYIESEFIVLLPILNQNRTDH